MKKTYPTSTKSQQYAKHLRPFGKRLANKSTRSINKTISKQDDDTKLVVKPAGSRKRKRFVIEFNSGNLRWYTYRKYLVKGRRDLAMENLIKKHNNSTFGFMKEYKFRAKDLK